MSPHRKILFELEQDDDGYPPVAVEGVWAEPLGAHRFKLANTPFFATGATLEDEILAEERDGELWFVSLLTSSGNSLIRVILHDDARTGELRDRLEDLGCETEWFQKSSLVAVSVPPAAKLDEVRAYLEAEAERGWLGYEEPILREA